MTCRSAQSNDPNSCSLDETITTRASAFRRHRAVSDSQGGRVKGIQPHAESEPTLLSLTLPPLSPPLCLAHRLPSLAAVERAPEPARRKHGSSSSVNNTCAT